jgi:hypothetical protein
MQWLYGFHSHEQLFGSELRLIVRHRHYASFGDFPVTGAAQQPQVGWVAGVAVSVIDLRAGFGT